jgi:hypothetical protein
MPRPARSRALVLFVLAAAPAFLGPARAAGCVYDGALYPEGTRAEAGGDGSRRCAPGSLCLCLPRGFCARGTAVLPVYQCSDGRWRCVSACRP